MAEPVTYNPKQISIALDSHLVKGYADDSFVNVEPNGDGVTKKVGCDGEVVRSISPDETYTLSLSLLQGSETNTWLQNKYAADVSDGNGMFSVTIKDLKGGLVFNAQYAWVTKSAARGYGKESSNIEWEIHTASGTLAE